MSANKFSSPDVVWRRARKCENGGCAEVAAMPGMVALRSSRDPDGPVVQYTADEWITFLEGARSGDFDGLV
ncbi:MAG TPA: DUF397 domain-containing protein [Streptosporangiaceae bacterium]|nr:DUF397 domain-containing protein [Streptosporangiaceae bacterium]